MLAVAFPQPAAFASVHTWPFLLHAGVVLAVALEEPTVLAGVQARLLCDLALLADTLGIKPPTVLAFVLAVVVVALFLLLTVVGDEIVNEEPLELVSALLALESLAEAVGTSLSDTLFQPRFVAMVVTVVSLEKLADDSVTEALAGPGRGLLGSLRLGRQGEHHGDCQGSHTYLAKDLHVLGVAAWISLCSSLAPLRYSV